MRLFPIKVKQEKDGIKYSGGCGEFDNLPDALLDTVNSLVKRVNALQQSNSGLLARIQELEKGVK